MTFSMEELVNLCKQRGFVFQGSEIYGGMSSTYDFGPLGVELVNNLKQDWWNEFVHKRLDMVGQDASILMHQNVWKASGHVGGFSDPLMDCKECKTRWRADKLIEEYMEENVDEKDRVIGWPNESTPFDEMSTYITDHKIACPNCGATNFTDIRKFNLMFQTHQGVIADDSSLVYLRPETAQGIFVNFKAVQQSSRKKVPFGIARIGEAFRNEITPGNFIFRVREFEQMEIEYFVAPDNWEEKFEEWKKGIYDFALRSGVDKDMMRFREHGSDELSHYSSQTFDIEYKFPFGWSELWGLAYRGCFDLSAHAEASGKNLSYTDPHTNETYVPHVIEPSVGVGRLVLATLLSSYKKESVDGEERTVLQLPHHLAPFKVAVLPLVNKLTDKAEEVFGAVSPHFHTDYDTAGSIGKRYRRQDEIGTPFCITVDYDTLEDESVTVRDRDSMSQERVKILDLVEFLKERVQK